MSELKLLISTPGDINEHLQVMHDYAKHCKHITEMGVRNVVSVWAWLEAHPQKLVLYDIADPPEDRLTQAQEYAKAHNIELTFIKADVLDVSIEETDLLFIDTAHYYDQLKQELALHGSKVRKYIVLHDTEFFQEFGEDMHSQKYDANGVRYKGLGPAVLEFLEPNPDWYLKEHFTHNWGLSILAKK
jgi:hypothetical protein